MKFYSHLYVVVAASSRFTVAHFAQFIGIWTGRVFAGPSSLSLMICCTLPPPPPHAPFQKLGTKYIPVWLKIPLQEVAQ